MTNKEKENLIWEEVKKMFDDNRKKIEDLIRKGIITNEEECSKYMSEFQKEYKEYIEKRKKELNLDSTNNKD